MIIRARYVLRATGSLCIRARRPALAALGLAFFLWLVLVAPGLIVPARSDASLKDVSSAATRDELQDARLTLQNEVRATLLQALGGIVVLLGGWVAWRQLQVSREGQITDRLTRAVDQLGSSELDITLGGIYALERIAKDSAADRDAVREILATYVRRHAPWPPQSGQLPQNRPLDRMPSLHRRAPGVQAALTVLSRGALSERGRTADRESRAPLDLNHTDLRKANLSHARLNGVDLQGAHLEGAELCEASMLGGIFNEAHLTEADLSDARLGSADLRSAYLQRANLRYTYLAPSHHIAGLAIAADLSNAHLEGADLRNADLDGACLDDANLEQADLRNTHLAKAKATDATRWPDGFDWQAAGVVLNDSDRHLTQPAHTTASQQAGPTP